MAYEFKSAGVRFVAAGMRALFAWMAIAAENGPAKAPPPAAGDSKLDRVDALGDPLPPGALVRFGTARTWHSSQVAFLAYLDGNAEILTVAADAIRVFDAATGKELRKFGNPPPVPGPNWFGVDAVALSADRKTLAIAITHGTGGTVQLWNIATGTEKASWKPNGQKIGPNGQQISAVALSADGKIVALTGYDHSLCLYQAEDGKRLRCLGNHADRPVLQGRSAMVFSRDSKSLLAARMELDNKTLYKPSLKRFETETGKATALEIPELCFHGVALAPDGAAAAWFNIYDGRLHIWDVGQNRLLHRIETGGAYQTVTGMAFSPDAKTLITCVHTGPGPYGLALRVWNVAGGKEIHCIRVQGYGNVAFSSDGTRIVAASMGSTLRQWHVESGKELPLLAATHHAPVVAIGATADAKTIVTRSGDNVVHVWDSATGAEIRHFALPDVRTRDDFNQQISADARTLVLQDYDQATIRTWDLTAAKEIKKWKVDHPLQLPWYQTDVALSQNGKLVAARTWNARSRREVIRVRLYDSTTGKELRPLTDASEPITGVLGPMAFSADGTTIAMVGDEQRIRVWDTATGVLLRRIDMGQGQNSPITFSPDRRTLATVVRDGGTAWNPEGSIVLWEVGSGKKRVTFKAGPNTDPTKVQIAYIPNGRALAVADKNVIRFFSTATGTELKQLQGTGTILALAPTPDGKTLLCASSDTTALAFDISAIGRQPLVPLVEIDSTRADVLWTDLASEDASRAYQASRELARGRQTVALLKERVRPIVAPDAQRVAQLIADLEAERPFAVRQQATEELEKLGELASGVLNKVLEKGPNLEMRTRVERLLERAANPVPRPEQLRSVRALEVLEWIGSADAQSVVKAISEGTSDARLTRAAHEALERMRALEGLAK